MNYREFRNRMSKRAGIYTDVAKSMAGTNILSSIPGVGAVVAPATLVGDVMAGSQDKLYDVPDKEWRKWTPGVSNMDLAMKTRKHLKDYGAKDTSKLYLSQNYGPMLAAILSTLAGGAAGAGIGAGVGGFSAGKDGALVGAGLGGITGGIAGFAAPTLLATLLAAVRHTRSKEEQAAYVQDPNSVKKNMLIPGYGTYNQFKTLGRMHADQNEEEEKQKAKNEK